MLGSLIFKSVSFLAAFPFIDTLAPAPLTLQNLIKVIAFYNGKYTGLLKSDYDMYKLLFMSFATYENPKWEAREEGSGGDKKIIDDDDEDLIMYSMEDIESWDEFKVIQNLETLDMTQFSINAKDLWNLIVLLLVFNNFEPHKSIDLYLQHENLKKSNIERYRSRALDIIRTINPSISRETLSENKIIYPQFKPAIKVAFPYLFKSLGNIFDQFLYTNKESDREHNDSKSSSGGGSPSKLLRHADLAQLATMLGNDKVFSKLVKLYMGSESGYSMRSFENKVFKWSAPTLFIISGKITSPSDHCTSKKLFDELIPPTRILKNNNSNHNSVYTQPGTHVTFGVIIDQPWKISNKEPFGDTGCLLFQLSPIQDIYVPSQVKKNYVYFSNVNPGGIGFGSKPPQKSTAAGGKITFPIENVSLILDESLEYGTFRHVGGGGSFHQSMIHSQAEYEARFEISGLEVWGYGGKEDLEEQQKKWEWEEREAEYRRKVNVKNYEDSRALLEMAGLVGNHNNSGGSV